MVAVTAQRVETASALPEAVERLASAAERSAMARLDLALHGITETVKRFGVSAGLLVGAAIVGLFAWICVVAGAVVLLAGPLGWGASFMIVGALQLAITAALAIPAIKTLQAAPATTSAARSVATASSTTKHTSGATA